MAFILLLVVGGLLLLTMVGVGTFFVLVQLGVIVNESRKPAHTDTNDYKLSQGRDVGDKSE